MSRQSPRSSLPASACACVLAPAMAVGEPLEERDLRRLPGVRFRRGRRCAHGRARGLQDGHDVLILALGDAVSVEERPGE